MPYNLRSEYLTLPAPEANDKREAINYADDVSAPSFGQSGLALRVYKSGKRTWFITYYDRNGKKARYTLGSEGVLDYFGARKMAEIKLAEAKIASVDPVEARRAAIAEQKRKASGADSFAGLARAYIEQWAKVEKRTWKEDARQVEKTLIRAWSRRDARAITRRDVRELLQGIVLRGDDGELRNRIAANRLLSLISKIFNWAIEQDLLPEGSTNPTEGLRRHTEVSRDRVLTEDEIKTLWTALDRRDDSGAPAFEPYFIDMWRLGLLTAQRRGELQGMLWDELDLDAGWWSLPSSRTKTKTPHRVPLVGQALDILRRRKAAPERHAMFVFHSARGNGHTKNIFKQSERLKEATGIEDAIFHDLRRTAATLMARLGVDVVTIEKLLNHALGGRVMQTYQRETFEPQKLAALEKWDAGVRRIVAGEPLIEKAPTPIRSKAAKAA